MQKSMRRLLPLFAALIVGCTGIPDGLQPVSGFQLERYFGTWYEIARLDHSFERGLSDVSAVYAPRPEGGVSVLNRGFNAEKNEWKEALGKAVFIDDTQTGSLKVSFFGPFYGGYHIVELDPDYHWAIVAGPSRDYLWLLTRTQHAPTELVDRMIESAARLGFPTERLIRVDHRPVDAPAL